MSANGVISVLWDYVHFGGLNLTSVIVSYENVQLVADSKNTSLLIRGLTSGILYSFIVTASNSLGSGQSSCPPIQHSIGMLYVVCCMWSITDIAVL